MRVFFKLVFRDIDLVIKGASDASAAILFYLLAIIMFPLSSGTDTSLLTTIAGGAIWMAAMFSSLLSLDRLFRSDFEDGSLEQLVLSGISMEFKFKFISIGNEPSFKFNIFMTLSQKKVLVYPQYTQYQGF